MLDYRHGTSRPDPEAAPGPAACAPAKTQRRAGRGARRATTRPAARTALRVSARAAAGRLSATGAAQRIAGKSARLSPIVGVIDHKGFGGCDRIAELAERAMADLMALEDRKFQMEIR